MKTISQPAVITPSIIVLALLAAAVVLIGVIGKKVPMLSNVRVDNHEIRQKRGAEFETKSHKESKG